MHITCPSACVGAYLAVPICLEHYSGIVTFIRKAKWWVLGTDYESMCALSSVDAVWGRQVVQITCASLLFDVAQMAWDFL